MSKEKMEMIRDVFKPEESILVLDDDSTCSGHEGHVVWLTEKGEEELNAGDNLHRLDEEMFIGSISVKDILRCWIENHGGYPYDKSKPHYR